MGAVPPDVVNESEPVDAPLHKTFVVEVIPKVRGAG